jgi:hypothetical protein
MAVVVDDRYPEQIISGVNALYLCLEDKQFESQPVYHFSQQIF